MWSSLLDELAEALVLGALLERVRQRLGGYDLLDHWEQGEFHHDVVLALPGGASWPFLVVATNCNGGVKEVLASSTRPLRDAVWRWRCPDALDFAEDRSFVPAARVTTTHWFDPCELLRSDARSELRPEHRTRQRGGGWKKIGCGS